MFWAFATVLCIAVQAFFSMQEMAIISVNRLEIMYFTAQNHRAAKRISYLISHPHALFTTTLVMVNFALQLGSECSRRFYASLDLSSNWAPLTQVILVVIIAELAPMFTARYWPRPVSFFGAHLVYFSACVLKPISEVVGKLTLYVQNILKLSKSNEESLFSRDELSSIFRRIDATSHLKDSNLAQEVSDKLLRCRSLTAFALAKPIEKSIILSAACPIHKARSYFIHDRQLEYILVYEHRRATVTGVIFPRSLINQNDDLPVSSIAKQPFFVGAEQTVFQWLAPLRTSRYPLAVVLDHHGRAIGSLTFDDIADFLFQTKKSLLWDEHQPVLEKAFKAQVTLCEIRRHYGLSLHGEDSMTLGQWVLAQADRPLRIGDCFNFPNMHLRIEKMGLFYPKEIYISTSANPSDHVGD